MANMSYCRFQNTLRDLRDCANALEDMAETGKDLSGDELRARDRLIELCKDIADGAEGLIEDWKDLREAIAAEKEI